MGTVRFQNDQFAQILGYGDLVQGDVMIKRLYYVECLNHNLFSVVQFCDAVLEVAFRKSTCFVRDLQGNDLFTGTRGSDIYTIALQESSSPTLICFMAKASPTQAWLWHRRPESPPKLREASMSKDISGSKLLAPSLCNAYINLAQHLAPSVGLGIPIYPKKKTEEGMVDSHPMEEEFRGAVTREVGTKTHGGPIEPVLQTQKTPSPSLAFIKENIDVLRTMIKEHDQQAKMKATPRKLTYVVSDKEAPAGSLAREQIADTLDAVVVRDFYKKFYNSLVQEDAYEDLNSPYKRPKPTPFTQRITCFKYHRRAKLPQNIRVYEGNKDPEDHLGGAARKWFDDLDPKSVDSFKELKSEPAIEEKWSLGAAEILGSQHQRMLSVKKANRGSCGLEEVGSSGEGHSPEQLAEWESGKERCKDHKHDKGRRKSQEAF
ncbi:hypothetical protein Tco_0303811 [Tanacetum coccineum]